MMAYQITAILDTIRENASDDYSLRVPAATQTNLTTVGEAITAYTATANEFVSSLINRIAMVIVHNKVAKNPLAILKKGGVPLGTDIEEIYTNPAKAATYDISSTDLLANKLPDVKAMFYRINRQDKYPVTVTRQNLKKAFTSEAAMAQFIDSIVSSLYSGDNYDEFILMKNLIATAYSAGHLNKVTIFDENSTTDTDEDIAKALVKNIKTYSNLFQFPSEKFTKYNAVKTADTNALITWTPLEDQILVLDAECQQT
jgi:hypothetical protein